MVHFIYERTKIVKDHPFTGVGFGNFKTVFPRYRQPDGDPASLDSLPTRVHNGYMQTAVENGIPGLALYLVLVACVYVLLVKAFAASTGHGLKKALIAGFITSITGYLVQDLSGWSEIALTPFFWVVLGLSVSLSGGRRDAPVALKTWRRNALLAAVAVCVLILVFFVGRSFNAYQAEKLLIAIRSMDMTREWQTIEPRIDDALERVSEDYHYEDQAGLLYMERLSKSGDPRAYKKGASILENAHLHNPFDPYALIHRIDMDTTGIRKGVIKEPSEFTETAIKTLLTMDSNNASVHVAIAKLRAVENKFSDSLVHLDRAKRLQPSEVKYYSLEGYIHRLSKDPDRAIGAYREALRRLERQGVYTLDEWGEAKQGVVFSYLDKRNLADALKEVNEVNERFPDYVQSRMVTGDIYATMGDFARARDSFSMALRLEPTNSYARERIEMLGKLSR